MRIFIEILLAVGLIMATFIVYGETWTDPDTWHTWEYLIKDDGTVEICQQALDSGTIVIPSKIDNKAVTSIGDNAFCGFVELTGVTIPSGVTSIGNNAFFGCDLRTVIIPSGVMSIGESAFSSCEHLRSVTMPSSVTNVGSRAFAYCSGLTSVTIPSGVTDIGDYVFIGCSGLSSLAIPGRVTSIGVAAFSDCNSITNLTISNGVMHIGRAAFSNCSNLMGLRIPSSVTNIAEYAFKGCSGLRSIAITSCAVHVGGGAFEYCTNVVDVVAPGSGCGIPSTSVTNLVITIGTTNISYGAFNGWSRLMHVTIPDSVVSIEDSAFSDCCGLASVTIPDNVVRIGDYAFSNCSGVKGITIPDRVTKIGAYAFSGCNGLTYVEIPNSVTNIGAYAFKGCSGLTNMVIPDSVTNIEYGTFSGCGGLKSVIIPSSVANIGSSAFYGCSELMSMVVPGSVMNIGSSAFYGCIGLTNIVLSSSVTNIGYGAFSGCRGLTSVTIPPNVKNIGGTAFCGCSGLRSVTIPDGVVSIGVSAFYGCSSLANVMIPDSVVKIDNSVFRGCKCLESVTIPDGVTRIGDSTFSDCIGLKSIAISSGVTSIGVSAFNGCEGLTNLEIPSSVTNIDTKAFSGCGGLQRIVITSRVARVGQEAFKDCTNVVDVVVPGSNCGIPFGSVTNLVITEGTTRITDNAFNDCNGLVNVTMPNSVVSIGNSAFNGCSGLSRIVIPDSVVSIGNTAFGGCSGLTSINVPNSVTNVGDYAFCGCSNLTVMVVPEGVTSFKYGVFDGCTGLREVTFPTALFYTAVMSLSSDNWILQNGQDGVAEYKSSAIGHAHSASMSLTLIGPHNLAFEWMVSSENLYDYLTYRVDGSYGPQISGTRGNWQKVIRYIPEGQHTVTWTYSKNDAISSGSDCGWVRIQKSLLTIFPDNVYSNLTSVVLTGTETEIPANAFKGWESLDNVTIPPGVWNIGTNAFDGCTALTAVHVSDMIAWASIDFADIKANPLTYAHNLYLNGSLVTDMAIPEGVDFIKDYAFYDCRGLTSVTIPSEVISIGNSAFYGCIGLTNATMSSGLTSIGNNAFYGCSGLKDVTISEDVANIGNGAFYGCTSLSSVIIPNSVTNIGENAFAGCSATVTVPDTVLSKMHENMFSECPLTVVVTSDKQYIPDCVATNVRKVVFADGVTRITDDYFAQCVNLETIDIAESVLAIGTNVFEACSALETVVTNGCCLYQGWVVKRRVDGDAPQNLIIPDGVRGIAPGVFEGEYGIEKVDFPSTLRFVGAGAFRNCTGLEGISLPEGVVAVDREAFRNCTYALELSMPDTLRSIGNGAFANCSQLMAVDVPYGVADIGEIAFSNCWRMFSVEIPYSVKNIGSGAFAECRRLTGVTVPLGVKPMSELFPAAYDKITTVRTAERRNEDNASQTNLRPMVPGMFAGCGMMEELVLPEWLTAVSSDAFSGCTNMAAFNLPDAVTSIGARAFKNLAQLSSFTFPTGLVSVGYESFSGCTGIGALALPDGLKSIGWSAFHGLPLLSRVDIPGGVISIGTAAFGGCERIRAVSLPGNVATRAKIFPDTYRLIASVTVVNGRRVKDALFEGCVALVAVEMPQSLTAIGARAFRGCTSLTAAGIPSGVTSLGEEVFAGCSSLSQIALPNGLASLPMQAFAGCSSLVEIVVPENVTALAANVFKECGQLRSIRFVGNAPSYDAAVYDGTDAALVTYVPNGSTGWDGVATSRSLPEFWPDGTAHEIIWWTPNRFKVSFDPNGGAGDVAEVDQVTGTTYVMPIDATRQGAVFGGWWTSSEGGARVTPVTQVALTRPHTFYAHWTFNRYSISFDANGGEGEMKEQMMTVATSANLPGCGFLRVGYAFVGWATEPDGEAVYADAAEVLDLAYEQGANVTLYAVWAEKEWTLADYVDVTNLVFRNDEASLWTPDWTTFKKGGVSLRSGAIPAAEEGGRANTTLTALVGGEGTGSFWWKVSCEDMDEEYEEWYDYAVFTIDGVEVAKIAGDSGWQQVNYTVTGIGPHTLAWTFSRDDYDEDGADWQNCAWLDEVMWTPPPVTVTFNGGGATNGEVPTAVVKYAGYELTLPGVGTLVKKNYTFIGWSDGPNTYAAGETYVFGSFNTTLTAVWEGRAWTLQEAVFGNGSVAATTTGGDADWAVDTTTGWLDGVSVKSGTISNGQSSWIEIVVIGEGMLTFRWNVMGGLYRGTPFAYAKVELDGVQIAQEHKTDGWKEETLVVEGARVHTIRWTYMRSSSRAADGDCVWLDGVEWVLTSEDAIPAVSGDEEVAEALAGSADGRLAEYIKTASEYNAFRAWVDSRGLDHKTVKDSPRAWLSYALDAKGLIEREFQKGDVAIDSLKTADGGVFTFEVDVEGVRIGINATAENLARVFSVEGTSDLNAGSFSAETVTATFGVTEDGRLSVVTVPKSAGSSFFVRVCMMIDAQ